MSLGKAERGRFSWRTRAEKPLNLYVFMSVHPAILLAEFSVTYRESFRNQLIDVAFTWYGLIASLGLFLVLRWLLNKFGLVRRGYWLVLVPFGSIIGISADLFTKLFEGQPMENIIGGIPQDHYFAIAIGGLLSVASALLETVRQDYEETRLAIISEKVRQASGSVQSSNSVLAAFVTGAKQRLQELGSSSEVMDFAKNLRTFVSEELRPLSHSLWEREEKQQRKFTLNLILRRVLAQPIRYPIPVALFAVAAAARSILARDPILGIANLATLFLILLAVLYGFAFVHKRGWIPTPLSRYSFLIVAALAGLAAVPTPRFFVEYDERINTLNYFILATLIICLAGAVTSTVAEVRALLKDQAKELRALLEADDLSESQALLLAATRARDSANYLHSTTQNQLLALAMRLEENQAGKPSKQQLQQLEEILDDALKQHRPTTNLLEGIDGLRSNWKGLIEIQVVTDQLPEMSDVAQEILFLAIREAVSNSYRHGSATQVLIELAANGVGYELRVSDNGRGLTSKNLGLGAKIFQMAGEYRLENRPEGGVLLRIVT